MKCDICTEFKQLTVTIHNEIEDKVYTQEVCLEC